MQAGADTMMMLSFNLVIEILLVSTCQQTLFIVLFWYSFNLVIEILLVSTYLLCYCCRCYRMFQSRNRDTFGFYEQFQPNQSPDIQVSIS